MDRMRVLLANHDGAYLDRLSAALTAALPAETRVTPLGGAARACEDGPYDAVVCAVQKAEELDVLLKIRKRGGRLPIIALIEPGNGELARSARGSGADMILQKSSDPAATARSLRLVLQLCAAAARTNALCERTEANAESLRDLTREARQLVGRAWDAAAPDPRDHVQVLVVEDDAPTAELLERALRSARFGLPHVVHSGEEALGVLNGDGPWTSPAPELVLLDLHMPGLSGFDVLRRMKAVDRIRRVPAIVCSDSADPEDERVARELGAISYLRKPITIEGMAAMISSVRAIWRALARP